MKLRLIFAFISVINLSTFAQSNADKIVNSKIYSFDTIINDTNGIVQSFSYFFGDSIKNLADSSDNIDFVLEQFFKDFGKKSPFSQFEDTFEENPIDISGENMELMFNLFNQFFQGFNLKGLNFEEFMDEPEPTIKEKPKKEPNKKEEATPPLKTIRI
jgi:hypothetical protein